MSASNSGFAFIASCNQRSFNSKWRVLPRPLRLATVTASATQASIPNIEPPLEVQIPLPQPSCLSGTLLHSKSLLLPAFSTMICLDDCASDHEQPSRSRPRRRSTSRSIQVTVSFSHGP